MNADTARNPDRLHRVGLELKASIAAFDAIDFDRLSRFFDALLAAVDVEGCAGDGPIAHVEHASGKQIATSELRHRPGSSTGSTLDTPGSPTGATGRPNRHSGQQPRLGRFPDRKGFSHG